MPIALFLLLALFLFFSLLFIDRKNLWQVFSSRIRTVIIVGSLLILGYVAGYFSFYGKISINPKLLSAIAYIHFYYSEHNQYPPKEQFDLWTHNNYGNWLFSYSPTDSNYKVGAWDGDSTQCYNSSNWKFSNDNC